MTRPSWVLALFALAGGCSFALSGPDPRAPVSQEPKCDTDKTSVLGDSLLATAAGITTLAVGANDGAAAIAPAVLGAVFAAAAIHGNIAVNQCRAAKEAYVAQLHAPPPPPVADVRDERADERAQLVRSPAATAPVAAAAPAPMPALVDPAPVPASATPAPAPAAEPAPPSWSAFWKEVR